ncbi:MAG: regulatory protein RecX [Alphaproteobacteria bacterium]
MSELAASRRRPSPGPITPERLHAAALRHLARYATSSANLRRVLQRRVDRSARLAGTDPAEAAPLVEAVLARLTAAGLLDDAAYAEGLARGLRRRGASRRMVRAKMGEKGVGGELAAAVLAGEEDAASAELAAARALARRRRLGPWRDGTARAGRRDRDLAALARAGFDLATARAVIDTDAPDG